MIFPNATTITPRAESNTCVGAFHTETGCATCGAPTTRVVDCDATETRGAFYHVHACDAHSASIALHLVDMAA
jgi:hypothetical protein